MSELRKPATPTAEDSMEGAVGPNRRKLPDNRKGLTHKVEINDVITGRVQEGYVIGNVYPDGTLGEIMLHGFGKEGSTLEGWTQVAAVLLSIGLQYGAEFPVIARKLAHMKFEPYGPTNNPELPYCNSVPDYIVRYLALRFGTPQLREEIEQIGKEMVVR